MALQPSAGIAFLEELHRWPRSARPLGLGRRRAAYASHGALPRPFPVSFLDTYARVLAVLDGCEVGAAVTARIGYARALGKRIDGNRTNTGSSGDCSDLPVNLALELIDRGGEVAIQELTLLDWGLVPRLMRDPTKRNIGPGQSSDFEEAALLVVRGRRTIPPPSLLSMTTTPSVNCRAPRV